MFSTLLRMNSTISAVFNLSSANAVNLDHAKILLFGKKLTPSENIKICDFLGKLFL